MTPPDTLDACFRISLHDMDMFSDEMISVVKRVLMYEKGFDHLHFRVMFDTYSFKDLYVPVDPDRDYELKGYDDDFELQRVLSELQKTYTQNVSVH